MYRAGGEGGQLHSGALGVAHGGHVRGGDDHHLVGHAGGHLEALPKTRRGVDETPVIAFPDVGGQLLHRGHGQLQRPVGHRCGEQGEGGVLLVGHGGLRQRTAPGQHIGEIHQRPVAEPQCQVQVTQRHVAVHAQHPLAHGGQRQRGIGGKGGLSGASLAGHHGDDLAHGNSFQRSGDFLMRAKLRGNCRGVAFTFSMMTARWRTSVCGTS